PVLRAALLAGGDRGRSGSLALSPVPVVPPAHGVHGARLPPAAAAAGRDRAGRRRAPDAHRRRDDARVREPQSLRGSGSATVWLRAVHHPQEATAMTFVYDLKIALRSLVRAKGLSATVVATLALGIGANAAIFSLVRGVVLRPLVNRDEASLLYIRQSASGVG